MTQKKNDYEPQQQASLLKPTYQDNWIQILIQKVAGNQTYQIFLFLHFGLKWVIAGMILFSLNFIYIVPDFQCSSSQLQHHQTCQQYVCSSQNESFWVSHLQQPIPSSISLDYGIIMLCGNKWISSVLQFLLYFGSFVGQIGMSYVADNYSRKETEKWSWIICIIGIGVLISSVNLYMVSLGTILIGLGTNAATNLHYTFLKEFMVGSYRSTSIVSIQILFSLGISLISLVSLLFSNWKIMLFFFIAIPSIILLIMSHRVEQTPKFSMDKGSKVLLSSLNKIAKQNRTQSLNEQDLAIIPKQKNNDAGYSFPDLFYYPSLRTITIVCGIINFVMEFIYDATILSLDKIGFSVYANQFIVGLVEILAALAGTYLVIVVKRRDFVMYSMAIGACITLTLAIISHFNYSIYLQVLLMGALRFDLNCVWGIFFVYAAQLFPSDITSLSLGFISAIGTVGAFLAPFIRLFTAKNTMLIMCGLCLLTIPLIKILQQTKGRPLEKGIKERRNIDQML